MKIVIYGANETACLIAAKLYEDHDIVVIDSEETNNADIQKLDIEYIEGSGSNIAVLESAGIKEADIFIACSENDEANIVSCLTVTNMTKLKTACFVSKQDNVESLSLVRGSKYQRELMIDYVLWPEELLTQEIFRIITVPNAIDVENFANGKARLLEYRIIEGTKFLNKKIKDCSFPDETLIVGITRDNTLFIPNGDTELLLNDKVIFMGSSYSLDILANKFFQEKNDVKQVTVIGGGNVGLMLAKNLEKANMKIKIIEYNYDRCVELTENLKNTLVINGDGANFGLLEEERVNESDVVVCVTNNDEKNLLCSLLAKQLGVDKVITRVSKNANANLFEKVGIDVAISQDAAAIDDIENHLIKTEVEILATVERGQGKVLEICIPFDFKTDMIMNLKLPCKAIIAIIQRRNRVIIPRGTTQIMPFDNLMVFTTQENADKILNYFKRCG
ncbi:MAG: Trk system potassium transporter TrkA [Candidatus Gastranaerophilales bacterium]|nr:Trk system potassium transporter TrkA [Candidatus Gastranaerophilales bacterium]